MNVANKFDNFDNGRCSFPREFSFIRDWGTQWSLFPKF